MPRPGFVDGFKCLLGGFGWLLRTPGVWHVALVPLFIALLLTGALASSAIAWLPSLVADLTGPTGGTLGSIGVGALQVLAAVVGVLVSVLIGLALAQPLSGPALERLAREQERALGAPERPPTAFWLDIARSIKGLALSLAFGLPAMALLGLLSLVLPFASVVTVPLKLLVAAFTIAWDLCDYPLSIRGLRIRSRARIVFGYRGAVLGFALGLALAGLVPCLLFLFLPAGVAGASRLMWAVEQHERSHGRDLEGQPVAPAAG